MYVVYTAQFATLEIVDIVDKTIAVASDHNYFPFQAKQKDMHPMEILIPNKIGSGTKTSSCRIFVIF
jgi:hypothetical protein